jgi:mono/diheme cytochrome c family protein
MLALAVAGLLATVAGAQPSAKSSQGWPGCCGVAPWPAAGPIPRQPQHGGGGLLSGFAYIPHGSALRHQLGLDGLFDTKYVSLRNPLAPTPENARRGETVYAANCAACHGDAGLADGPGSSKLNPPPAQLGWLAKVPSKYRDGFMYWSIAEGGAHLRTDMPAYAGKLADADIWSVIGYVQARAIRPQPAR